MWQYTNVRFDMTFSIDRNGLRTILRINAGWMIWAGSLVVTHLVAVAACEAPAAMGGLRMLIISVGAIAAAGATGLLYWLVSNVRAHRAAHATRNTLAVDYLAGTVAALSLLGIVGTTILSATSSLCLP